MPATITLYYWSPKDLGDYGHLALKITGLLEMDYEENEIYISYWPKDKKRNKDRLSKPAWLANEHYDKSVCEENKDGNTNKHELDLTPLRLDVDRMVAESAKIRENIESLKWHSLASGIPNKKIKHCTTVVMQILNAGGFDNYLPLYAQHGSFKHFLLLSSTSVLMPSSVLMIGLYAVVDDFHYKLGTFFNTLFCVAINGTLSAAFLEQHFGCKKIIERHWSDSVIGVVGALGLVFPFILARFLIAQQIDNETACVKLPADVIALASAAITIPPLCYAVNLILYHFDLGYVKTPTIVFNNVSRIVEMNARIGANVPKAIFKKHVSFAGIVAFGYLVYDITRNAGLNHENSLYVGMLSATLGYGLLKCVFIRRWDRIINNKLSRLRNNASALEFLKSHNGSVGRCAFVNLTTLLGMLSLVFWCKHYTNIPEYGQLTFSISGVFIGYFCGSGLEKLQFKLFNKIRSFNSGESIFCGGRELPFYSGEDRADDATEDDSSESENNTHPVETNWIFILLIGLLSGCSVFLLQYYLCSDYPSMKWVSLVQGTLVGSAVGFFIDKMANCPQRVVDRSTANQTGTVSVESSIQQTAAALTS